MTLSPLSRAARIAGWYAAAGMVWIAFSDRLAEVSVPAELLTRTQTYKGWAFVAVSAGVVFLMSLRALRGQAAAHRTLAREKSRFEAYIQHAPMAVFILNARGEFVDGNQRAADLVGCDLPTLRTLSISAVTPTAEDRTIASAAMAGLAEDRWIEGDYRLLRCDGRIIWIHARAAALDAGQIITFAYDVTAQKNDDERLRQAAAVFDSTREGIVVTDRNAEIIATNPAFSTITGYAETEVIGQNPRLLNSGVQDRDWYREMWRAIHEAGYWQGEIWNRRKNGEIYPEWLSISAVKDAQGAVANYVGVFTDITRLKHSEAQLDHLAHTDALTGLANRLLLRSRLDHLLRRAFRTGARVAVAVIDIDHFRRVNEVSGLEGGDEILRSVATRLRAALDAADTLARLGADEFVVLRDDLSGPQAAADLARTILETIAPPFALADGRKVHLSVSVGVSVFPDDSTEAAELLQQAGAAMAHAKNAGGRAFRFHTRSMQDAARARFALEAELRQAVERGEFLLHYQPRVFLDSGRIEGVEALVRWHAPDGRIRQPEAFISLAESIGLIERLGEWILSEACRQQRAWVDAGLGSPTVAVNVAPQQFQKAGFVDRVEEILSASGVNRQDIEFEITESTTFDPAGHAEEQIRRLTALGARVAIDDFGTGYSSLSRLSRLPVDTLKIDRAFLRDVPGIESHGALVATIVSLARSLKMKTVAEGVETEGQAGFLRECGCEMAQGFLFGPPMPVPDITERLSGER